MVCVPCIVVPFLLWVFHKYIRPIVMKFWNPWRNQQKVDSKDTDSKSAANPSCPFAKDKGELIVNGTDSGVANGVANGVASTPVEADGDKKND